MVFVFIMAKFTAVITVLILKLNMHQNQHLNVSVINFRRTKEKYSIYYFKLEVGIK